MFEEQAKEYEERKHHRYEDFALGFVIYGDELKEALRKSFEKLIPKNNRAEFIY